MNLTMYTYGYSETVYNILQAVAMIRESGLYMALIQFVSIVTVFSYAVRGAYLSASGGHKQFLMKGIGLVLVIQLLLLPKASMLVEDIIEHKIHKVDNIPIAFALPVGIIESIGMVLSSVFEQAFAPIESLSSDSMTQSSYYKYGSVFSARLKKELSQSRIRDPEFLENMRNFHKQCIILPSMIGYQFTPQELLTSKNMWKLVKDKAGTLTRFDMRVGKTRTTMNCKEAVDVFENYFNDEIVSIVNRNINKVFGRATGSTIKQANATAGQLSQIFFANIKANYSEPQSAQETLKQHMMVNFIGDYNMKYGSTRARMQQESSALISSDLAQTTLPISLVLFKCMISAIFIFVIPIMLMPGGMKAFISYLKIFLSLQLWPALNSILNMVMVMHSNQTPGNNNIISYSTASTVANNMDTIVTIAGNLQPLIPVIAYYIVSSSSNAMANLAGSLSGSINSAASMAAGEVTTGNRSFDNVSEGNLTKNMRNANKTDLNQSYVSGEIRQQLSDGTAKSTHADGTNTYVAPEPEKNYNLSTATATHVSQGLTNSVAEHDQKQNTYSEAKTNTMAKSTAYLANLIERQHAGETLGIDTSTKEGQDLSKMVEMGAKEYEKNGHDKTQAASTTLRGGITGEATWGGKGGSKGEGGGDGFFANAKKAVTNYAFGKIAGALLPDDVSLKVSAALEGDAKASSQSDQGIGEEGHHSEAVNVKKNLEVIENAANGKGWGKEISHDQTKAEEVRAAYTEEKTAREEVSKSAQKVKEHQNLVQHSATVTATSDENMKPQLIEQLTNPNRSEDTAAQMVQKGHPEVDKVFNKIVSSQVAKVAGQIERGREALSPENLNKRLKQTGEDHKDNITTNPEDLIKKQDNPTTADFDNIPKDINAQKKDLGEKFDKRTEVATRKINTTEEAIAEAAQPLKDEIKVEDGKSFRKNTGGYFGIGRQNDQTITSKTLKEIGGGSDSLFTAPSGPSASPGNISFNAGKGTGQGAVALGGSNNSAKGIPTTQVEQTPSHINPQGVNKRGKGSTKAVQTNPTTVNLSNLQKAGENNNGNQDKPSSQNTEGGNNSAKGIPASRVGTTNTATTTPADSGSGESPVPISNSNSAVPQMPEATKAGGKESSTSNPNIGSNNLDSQGNKKPTAVNLSNLQKAERKNK